MKLYQLSIVSSITLGTLAGLFFPQHLAIYSALGTLFIHLLKYIVVPLVFGSLISGIMSLGNWPLLRSLSVKTGLYFFLTTVLSSCIGITIAMIIQPGRDFPLNTGPIDVTPITLQELFMQIIPTDFFAFISGQTMLFLIILSIILGILGVIFRSAIPPTLHNALDRFNRIIATITHWIILLAPIGIFGLIAQLIASTGLDAFVSLAIYMATCLMGLIIYALVVIPVILWMVTPFNPITVARSLSKSLAMGFMTASSAATLPILMNDARESLDVPDNTIQFILPLGITINMDGTALFQSVAVIFMAQMYDIHLSLVSFGLIVFTALLASISAAAIPSAGVITMSMMLTTLGIPLNGIGMILSVDRLLDMTRTAVNLWGNGTATLVIHQWMSRRPTIDKKSIHQP